MPLLERDTLLAQLLGHRERADRHFEHALRLHERLGARPLLARSQYEYARMLLAETRPGETEWALVLLDRALDAVRPFVSGRLIVVFGCGGDRDRGKRPLMGAIAESRADHVILTSDNPRTEDPERILNDIEAGMQGSNHERIEERRAAIAHALDIAGPEDMVLLAGKGHETYQIRGTTSHPFDEQVIVRELAATMGSRT